MAATHATILDASSPTARGRLVLAGQPRFASRQHAEWDEMLPSEVLRPKDLLLVLAAAEAERRGQAASRQNPHFMAASDRTDQVEVMHFGALELTCPVPRAENTLVIDGEDLLALAEERRLEDKSGLRWRRLSLMQRILSAGHPSLEPGDLLPAQPGVAPFGAGLPGHGGGAPAAHGTVLGHRRSGPVQWMACDLQTGPYNFLELRRQPRLSTSQVGVLLQLGSGTARPSMIGFATPNTLPEWGPVLRAFAAIGVGASGQARLFLFFFGSPEEFASAVAAHPQALFFGDNFRCRAIQILFAPFGGAEVLDAIRAATCTVDTAFGGVLEGLAREMGVARRIVLGVQGEFDVCGGVAPPITGIDWQAALQPRTLTRRRQKASRAGERRLAEVMEAMLG
jgi:hypothetical protein